MSLVTCTALLLVASQAVAEPTLLDNRSWCERSRVAGFGFGPDVLHPSVPRWSSFDGPT